MWESDGKEETICKVIQRFVSLNYFPRCVSGYDKCKQASSFYSGNYFLENRCYSNTTWLGNVITGIRKNIFGRLWQKHLLLQVGIYVNTYFAEKSWVSYDESNNQRNSSIIFCQGVSSTWNGANCSETK